MRVGAAGSYGTYAEADFYPDNRIERHHFSSRFDLPSISWRKLHGLLKFHWLASLSTMKGLQKWVFSTLFTAWKDINGATDNFISNRSLAEASDSMGASEDFKAVLLETLCSFLEKNEFGENDGPILVVEPLVHMPKVTTRLSFWNSSVCLFAHQPNRRTRLMRWWTHWIDMLKT